MQAIRNLFRGNNGGWAPMSLDDQDEPGSAREMSSTGRSLSAEDPESAREAYDDINYEEAPISSDRKSTGRKVSHIHHISGEKTPVEDELIVEVPLEPLMENIYGFAIATLIQDSADLNVHPRHCCHSLRALRITTAFGLSTVMFSMQCFLIFEAKKLVTPHDVAQARKVYGKFEDTMYEDSKNVSHTWKTSNGYPRGYDGYYNETNFNKLSMADKELVCRVPLSQPFFLFGVLFIWTLTVLSHMRTAFNLCNRIYHLPTLTSMEASLQTRADGTDEVVGLTRCLKIVLLWGVQFPRISMNGILLWLGARWLVATLGFGDLFLNALALEFILNLSGLLYEAMVPHNSKLLVQKTLIPHVYKRENENCCNMFGMLLIGLLAGILVFSYMIWLQTVLPHYKWDVAVVCHHFLEEELAL